MIPFASCMCFQGRGAQWTSTPGKKQNCVEIRKSTDNKICIFISDKPISPDDTKRKRPLAISRSEWSLLHALEQSTSPVRPSICYQTPQRKPYNSRLPIIRVDALKSALLDDAYQGVTRNLLDDCGRWAFNTFHLDVSTGGRSLPVLMAHLFQKYNFFRQFNLDPAEVWRCFSLFESCYHTSNPYHNSVHAADVTQAMHCFLQEKKISTHITPVEAVSAILAAVAHDLDHPGVNQPFLIATSNHLAALYKNFSVLENHHWRVAISCLREAQIFGHLDPDIWGEIEYNIRSMILATDITRQQEFLAKFKKYMENGALDLTKPHHRHFILQVALKCADLCNPCRPWAISQCWSQQICQEFYKQGEYEKKLNLPITPICDKGRSTVAKIQSDFFKFVVTPLFDVWHGFLSSDLSEQLINNLHHNQQCWERTAIQAAEAAARNVPAICPVEEQLSLVDEDEDNEASPTEAAPGTVMPALEEDDLCVTPWGQRRCSMPLNTPKLLPCTSLRRQSFPHFIRTTPTVPSTTPKSKSATYESPTLSSRTLSSDQLQPRTSIVSLSSSETMSLLGLIARESHSTRLVHQPVSYPPFINTPSTKESRKRCPKVGRKAKSSCKHGSNDSTDDRKDPDNDGTKAQGQLPTNQLNTTVFNVENCTTESTNPNLTFKEQRTGNNSENFETPSECSVSCDNITSQAIRTDFHSHFQEDKTSPANIPPMPQQSTSNRVCQDSQRLPPLGNTLVSEYCKDVDVMEQVSSWCSQVSRTMSQESSKPPSHEFDSSVSSWKGSSSGSGQMNRLLHRRGSAPVTTSKHHSFLTTALKEIGQGQTHPHGRRWSLAAKPMQYPGTQGQRIDLRTSSRPFLMRRHSFGILEPFAAESSESDNDSSRPTSTGTTCSTRHSSREQVDVYCTSSVESCSSESHDMFPICTKPQSPLDCRRGSLPTDIPISLVSRISSYTTNILSIPGSNDSLKLVPNLSALRRASTGAVYGTTIGSSSFTTKTGSFNNAQHTSSSFGMCSGRSSSIFFKSSMGVCSSWQNVCGISKTARTSMALDSLVSEDVYAMRRQFVRLSSETPGVSAQQWRRGSAPIGIFLFSSTSSGNLASQGLED